MKKLEIVGYAVTALCAVAGYALVAKAQMQPPSTDVICPSEEPCQVLVLTATEIKVLVGDNGILATAAQARNLDLGQYVAYFRQKIALAPAGKRTAAVPAPESTATGIKVEPPKPPEVEPKK